MKEHATDNILLYVGKMLGVQERPSLFLDPPKDEASPSPTTVAISDMHSIAVQGSK